MKHNLAFYVLLVAVLVGMFSCNTRPNDVMDKEAMTSFLTDLHQLDGTLASKGLGYADQRENVYYYNALLKKHAITKAEFDSSLSWYAKNPKKLERIYNEVINRLTVLDQQVKDGYFHPVDSAKLRNSAESLWPDSLRKFNFSEKKKPITVQNTIKNRILNPQDLYELSFLYKLRKGNKKSSQRAVILIYYESNQTDSISYKLHNSGILCKYTIRLRAKEMLQVDSVKVVLNVATNQNEFADIDSIQLMRKYDLIAQDSIRQEIQKLKVAQQNSILNPVNYRLRSKILLQLHDETIEQPFSN